jgi:hypothetical protein
MYSATRSKIFIIIDGAYLYYTPFFPSLAHKDVNGARAILLFDNGYWAS